MNADRRVAALRYRLADESSQAFMSCDSANIAYLTGFENVWDEEPCAAAVVSEGFARVYTDGRYAEAARLAAEGTEWSVHVPDNLYIKLAADLAADGIDSLAAEAAMPFGRFRFISGQFKGNVDAVEGWVEDIRQVKEDAEIERIADAQKLTDACFEHLMGWLNSGVTETHAALEIETWLRRNGSEGVAFPAIVASGPNSSKPHAKPGERALHDGDFVVLDFGARVGGYCADMTRTVVLGAASERQREVFDAVLEAQLAGIAAARPGVPGSDVDAAARTVLASHGLAENFLHGLGHGVGLQVHELPQVSARGTKSLRAGAVVTIEPGAYVPGFGGVRIEDLIVVGENGARVLTSSPKHLIEL